MIRIRPIVNLDRGITAGGPRADAGLARPDESAARAVHRDSFTPRALRRPLLRPAEHHAQHLAQRLAADLALLAAGGGLAGPLGAALAVGRVLGGADVGH